MNTVAILSPTRGWIPPVIADLLKSGTRTDDHAYAPELLPRGWRLLGVLLERSPAAEVVSDDDPMMQAINSPKGKAVEALFLHALRVCRLADDESKSHAAQWTSMEPRFEMELAKCIGANFEFATLCGAYLAHLEYMALGWLPVNVTRIFPEAHPANNLCAIAGLAYSQPLRSIYVLLRDTGVIERAIRLDLKARHANEKLVERVSLAYLWGEEELDSARWSLLFRDNREHDLVIAARFFWAVRHDGLTAPQVERVISFWERCLLWAKESVTPPIKLMPALATLSNYLDSADGKSLALLLAVAPFVHFEHATLDFIEELQRITAASPEGVSRVLGTVLNAHLPSYDYEDRLKALIARLADLGLVDEATQHADRARTVSGMQELYDRLVAQSRTLNIQHYLLNGG